ncbi:hypothetical protein WP7S17E04_12830 [Escherichia coli]|nr:hypothetical protein WP7S17E04_12830 [Escherichia coli]
MTNNESKGPFEGLLVIDMTHEPPRVSWRVFYL